MPVLSHLSAAELLGLDTPADRRRHVTVPRNLSRPIPGAVVHRADLSAVDVYEVDGVAVTSVLRTVVDCARTLPFGWGLAVADSALRLGLVTPAELALGASGPPGRGTRELGVVARHADGRAGSCLESLTRALLIDAGIGPLALQRRLCVDGHPYDIEVPDARTLIECDSRRWHRGERLELDCEDTTAAGVAGHSLLRFTWDGVTRRPRWVVASVQAVVERNRRDIRRQAVSRRRTQTRRAAGRAGPQPDTSNGPARDRGATAPSDASG